MKDASAQCNSHGWVDKLAISMAAICAVHCLLTPVLVVMLPIIATSFFVHQDFHLWMLYLVIPTTSFAIYMGCRKHKDKWVATMSALGLSVLICALVIERQGAAAHSAEEGAACPHCVRDVSDEPVPMHAAAWINTLGGLFLASGHVRNFRLCRRAKCSH
ncbi:MAG: MerC domain-containing protein [Coraliomargarita sp.]